VQPVTAVAPTVPPALLTQLRPGGRMVIPVGTPDGTAGGMSERTEQPDSTATTSSAASSPAKRRIRPPTAEPMSAARGCRALWSAAAASPTPPV
ncbi:MAG: hypothetical protein J0J00_02275, partial [Microbacterium sp.]|nr:hypothetical protein [Microbacterium sp.]